MKRAAKPRKKAMAFLQAYHLRLHLSQIFSWVRFWNYVASFWDPMSTIMLDLEAYKVLFPYFGIPFDCKFLVSPSQSAHLRAMGQDLHLS